MATLGQIGMPQILLLQGVKTVRSPSRASQSLSPP